MKEREREREREREDAQKCRGINDSTVLPNELLREASTHFQHETIDNNDNNKTKQATRQLHRQNKIKDRQLGK